ncbi:glycine cleavage system T protein [Acrasis kona]|uniref:Aminomethyltransferase n=1 Tax=Acrasis kona TaxID=1008807 RepID=A0AAW2YGU5_9EUKA
MLTTRCISIRALRSMPNVIFRHSSQATSEIKQTSLFDFHKENKAKMVPFAGWKMPLIYPDGMKQEHNHCRTNASIFDVSHMGQIRIHGKDGADFIESIVPGNIKDLKPNHARLTQFTNEHGGIMDDTMVTRKSDDLLYVVVNAGCCDQDVAHIKSSLEQYKQKNPNADVSFEFMDGHSLIAIQGPVATEVVASLLPEGHNMSNVAFMSCLDVSLPALGEDVQLQVSRCGYTGEDGYEISVPHQHAVALTKLLLQDERVRLAGLAARDTLRLEAGLCLMGHDMNDKITPIEANLSFTIGKRRQEEKNFPGAEIIVQQLQNGTKIKRVGINIDTNKMVARENYTVHDSEGNKIGYVTSGTLAPSMDNRSIAMGYVDTTHSQDGTALKVSIRNTMYDATVVKMPFVPHRYYRKPAVKKQ